MHGVVLHQHQHCQDGLHPATTWRKGLHLTIQMWSTLVQKQGYCTNDAEYKVEQQQNVSLPVIKQPCTIETTVKNDSERKIVCQTFTSYFSIFKHEHQRQHSKSILHAFSLDSES